MDSFNRRISRKEKRNNVGYTGSRRQRRRKRFNLTYRGRILYIILGILIIGLSGYYIKIRLNNNTIGTEYASVTGDIIRVSSKLSGKISNINVKNGDVVNENELLFTLDNDLLKNQVDEAYAELQLAFEKLEHSGGGLKTLPSDKNRKSKSNKNNAYNIVMLQNAVKAAQSKYNLAKIALSNSNVLSPADGTIIESSVHIGDYVSPENAVISIVDFGDLNITAYINQKQLYKVKVGDTARIVLKTVSKRKFLGRVNNIGKATQGIYSNMHSETTKKLHDLIPIIISFNYSGLQLVPGIEAKVRIETNK